MKKKRLLQDNTLKNIFVAVVLAAVAVLLYWFTNKRKKITTYGVKGNGEISEAQAQYLAERLFDGMKNIGTDEDVINEVFEELSKHKRAVLQVHEAFGLQRYCLVGSDIIGIKLNLNQWLKKELSDKEYAKWQMLYESATK